MQTRRTISISQNKNMIRIVVATALILLVPLLGMLFTEQVDWGVVDFAVVGALLLGTGLLFELATSNVVNIKYRAAIGVALLAALLLVWVELAVGLVGSPISGS